MFRVSRHFADAGRSFACLQRPDNPLLQLQTGCRDTASVYLTSHQLLLLLDAAHCTSFGPLTAADRNKRAFSQIRLPGRRPMLAEAYEQDCNDKRTYWRHICFAPNYQPLWCKNNSRPPSASWCRHGTEDPSEGLILWGPGNHTWSSNTAFIFIISSLSLHDVRTNSDLNSNGSHRNKSKQCFCLILFVSAADTQIVI